MEDGVKEATFALAAALERGDACGAAALYADDAKLLTPAAELIAGRCDIESYWRAGIAFGLSDIELEAVDFQIGCGIAIEIGRYVFALVRGRDGRVDDRGKYLVLHCRQADGAWRRAVDVFNPDVPVAARHNLEEE
jgi:ketosteroid isomerase-like protein